MNLKLGACLKCGCPIMLNNRPTTNWKQEGYFTADGNILFVALCKKCHIQPEEYGAASRALNLQSVIVSDAYVDGKRVVDTIVEVARDAQGGKCFYCGKPLGENYVITNGRMCCERC